MPVVFWFVLQKDTVYLLPFKTEWIRFDIPQ